MNNLILVNGEVKKKNTPDVIREAKDELNASTSVFSSGLELNCHKNTNHELQFNKTIEQSLPYAKRERERDDISMFLTFSQLI